MDDIKFPEWSEIPPQKNRKLSMDEYLEFVLFCREAFPPTGSERRSMPAPVRFVIRDEGDETWTEKDPKK
jgi:hypothetical protein